MCSRLATAICRKTGDEKKKASKKKKDDDEPTLKNGKKKSRERKKSVREGKKRVKQTAFRNIEEVIHEEGSQENDKDKKQNDPNNSTSRMLLINTLRD